MAHGRPVIATGCSGNLAFMNSENSFLVPFDLVPVPAGLRPIPRTRAGRNRSRRRSGDARSREHPERAAAIGARAKSDVELLHSPARAGAQLADRLARIRARMVG